MTDHNRRASLRSRPAPRARPGPRADAVILYSVGRSIPRSDRNDLEVLLNQFHASEELQARCKTVEINARQYLSLDLDEDLGQRYKATILIPTGKYLAVYFGSLERARLGEEDTLNHSMAQGKLDFKYELIIDGTPRRGDTHPGRLQLVNHCCEPDNNSVCEEWSCPDTGLTAFFLRSVRDIPPDVEVKFPYQKPTFKNGVQVYPANHFWKEALRLYQKNTKIYHKNPKTDHKNPSDLDCSRLFYSALLRTFIAPDVPILSDVPPETHPPKIIFYRGRRIAGPVRVGLPKNP